MSTKQCKAQWRATEKQIALGRPTKFYTK